MNSYKTKDVLTATIVIVSVETIKDINMNMWIFQGHPARFDINRYLNASPEVVYWTVKHPKHQNMISIDDSVFLWRAKVNPGIIAYGKIVELCCPKTEVKHPQWLYDNMWESENAEPSEIKAGIKLEDIRLSLQEGMLKREQLCLDQLLQNMHLIKAGSGSNFILSYKEHKQILDYWNLEAEENTMPEELSYSSVEGNVRLVTHRAYERDNKLIIKAKERFLSQHGKLFCEICSFSFGDIYGELGEGFIEAHHKKPIHMMQVGEETELSDILMTCPNCHRMLHKLLRINYDPDSAVDRLCSFFR